MQIGLTYGDVRGQRDPGVIAEQIQATSGTAWISQGPNLDALTTLAVVGEGPAELGTAVVPFPQRHPLVLASQALTVQAARSDRKEPVPMRVVHFAQAASALRRLAARSVRAPSYLASSFCTCLCRRSTSIRSLLYNPLHLVLCKWTPLPAFSSPRYTH